MTDVAYARMMDEMKKVTEAMRQAEGEPDRGRRRRILEAAAYDAERALRIRGLDKTAQDWFSRKWKEAGEAATALAK